MPLVLMIRAAGTHYGGSCQVGFSTDGGETFKVAASYQGNCPHRNAELGSGQNFDLTIPDDLPAGEAVFAWTWINREQVCQPRAAYYRILADPPAGIHHELRRSDHNQP